MSVAIELPQARKTKNIQFVYNIENHFTEIFLYRPFLSQLVKGKAVINVGGY